MNNKFLEININLLFQGTYILYKPDETSRFYKVLSMDIRNYLEFCSSYNFKQLINCPARTKCNISTLIDQIHKTTFRSRMLLILRYLITL